MSLAVRRDEGQVKSVFECDACGEAIKDYYHAVALFREKQVVATVHGGNCLRAYYRTVDWDEALDNELLGRFLGGVVKQRKKGAA